VESLDVRQALFDLFSCSEPHEQSWLEPPPANDLAVIGGPARLTCRKSSAGWQQFKAARRMPIGGILLTEACVRPDEITIFKLHFSIGTA
jgi:hypothetical protein